MISIVTFSILLCCIKRYKKEWISILLLLLSVSSFCVSYSSGILGKLKEIFGTFQDIPEYYNLIDDWLSNIVFQNSF